MRAVNITLLHVRTAVVWGACTYMVLAFKLMPMITIQIVVGIFIHKVIYSLFCGYFTFRVSQGQFDNLRDVVSLCSKIFEHGYHSYIPSSVLPS